MVASNDFDIITGSVCYSRNTPVRYNLYTSQNIPRAPNASSYLLDGNILAARTFITQFTSLVTTAQPSLRSKLESAPLSIPGTSDEIIFTTDQTLNFSQLAVRTCQRAQGASNRKLQEAWVRLCGTYLSKGGVLSIPDIRKVMSYRHLSIT